MEKPENSILIVGGSPRVHGNSDTLMKRVAAGVADGVDKRIVHLRDYQFQPCIGCERCRKDKACTGLNDGMQLLYPEVLRSRGLVLVCPTHNYNITAWMKAFIDRLYCFYDFDDNHPRGWGSQLAGQQRKGAVIAVCEQMEKKDMGVTLEAMRWPMEAMGVEILEELAVLGVFARGAVKKEESAMQGAAAVGMRVGKALLESSF